MSWSSTLYPYSGGTQASGQTLVGVNPALTFQGTETNGGTTNIVEVAGGMFLLTNVIYNIATAQFNLVNSVKSGQGLFLGTDGSLTMYQEAAGSAPWTTWGITLWSYGASGSLGVTDINTMSKPLTIEATNVLVNLPNTLIGANLTVQNTSSTVSPRLYMNQNVSGGGQWGFDSFNTFLRFLYTPFGGTETSTAQISPSGGVNNGAYMTLNNGNIAPVYNPSGGTFATSIKTVVGVTGTTVTGGAGFVTVNLAGNAAFLNATSYAVTANYDIDGGSADGVVRSVTISRVSGTQFNLILAQPSGGGAVNVSWTAFGY